jgi:hypothetical protein
MNVIILKNGDLEMTGSVNDTADFKTAIFRDPRNIEGYRSDLLSGMLIDPMGDGIDYDLAPPEEFRRSGGLVIIDIANTWYYPNDDLFNRLAKGETITWHKI